MSALNCHEWSEKAFQKCLARSVSIHPGGERTARHKEKNARKRAERHGTGGYHGNTDAKSTKKKGKK